MNCYCCSGRLFEDCCGPFLSGAAKAPTAEALMRSRYAAYATADVDYILRTTHPSTRRFHEPAAIRQWAESSRWQKLEIVAAARGSVKDKRGTVEFKAYYLDPDGTPRIHHELSNFVKELGRWYFVDGRAIERG